MAPYSIPPAEPSLVQFNSKRLTKDLLFLPILVSQRRQPSVSGEMGVLPFSFLVTELDMSLIDLLILYTTAPYIIVSPRLQHERAGLLPPT